MDDEKYEGSGASKKMAKHACARAALTKLYNMSFTPHMPGKIVSTITSACHWTGVVRGVPNWYTIIIYYFTGRSTSNCSPSLEGNSNSDEIVPGNKKTSSEESEKSSSGPEVRLIQYK